MHIVADLQLHSKFSRAVSPQMTIPNISLWAKRKGIGLVATGDWTHPLWFREIETNLEELGNGLLKLKSDKVQGDENLRNPLFLLATEVSCIYTQNGKGRRVHTLIWVPTIDAVRKINHEMTKRGCNLMSDGRPIIGLTSIQVAELVFSVEPKALVIPAHCLYPKERVLLQGFESKEISDIHVGEKVLSHSGLFQKVTEVKKRHYEGDLLTLRPWYFRGGLSTTPEHPYYAIKTIKKCPSTGDMCRPSTSHLSLCRIKACLEYRPTWIQAKDIEVGDVLVYPRVRSQIFTTFLDLSVSLAGFKKKNKKIFAGGTRGKSLVDHIEINKDFGRFLGYYLAEGSTDKDNSFSFCFSRKETEYVEDILSLVNSLFQLDSPRIYRRQGTQNIEITFYSKILAAWLSRNCYVTNEVNRAFSKKIPESLLDAAPDVLAEILRGWLRGDKGYTSSRVLMNQIKAICLKLGIIPSIITDSVNQHHSRGNHHYLGRVIHANYDSFVFSNLAFFGDTYDLMKETPRSQTKIDRRHGWIDDDYVYIPVKDIQKELYSGDVYNLEVEIDHSFVAEFATVHNCWTPWFSVYGSMSGFDSLDEAFGPFANNIYAVETGLSSNPSMNWRIKELDSRSIVSFSDAHSGPKLGREATVFELSDQPSEFSYQHIYEAISCQSSLRKDSLQKISGQAGQAASSQQQIYGAISHQPSAVSRTTKSTKLKAHIAYTIEFYPEEGKYHYTGHRLCNIRLTPLETVNKGSTCPVCGKPLTQGVMQRVEELAGRSESDLKLSEFSYPIDSALGKQLSDGKSKIKMTGSKAFPNRPPFVMLVPLQEIISEAVGSPVASPKVQGPYEKLIDACGGEFSVLLSASPGDITAVAGERVAVAIDKVRKGDIVIDPGYDGIFGVVKIWKEGEEKPLVDSSKEQLSIF